MCVRALESRLGFTRRTQRKTRFDGNPFTSGPEPVRFYSSTPLRVGTGWAIGTLYVFDPERLQLEEHRLALLEDVAAQVAEHLELHRASRGLAHTATRDPSPGCRTAHCCRTGSSTR